LLSDLSKAARLVPGRPGWDLIQTPSALMPYFFSLA
jgi:hypothetical protein